MMNYCGIDLGTKSSAFCVMNEQGKILVEGETGTEEELYRQLFRKFSAFKVVVEACPLAEWSCQVLEELGHEAIIIDSRKGLVSVQKGLNSQIRGIYRAHGVRVGAVSEGKFYEHVMKLLSKLPEGLHRSIEALLSVWAQVTSELRELTVRLADEVEQDKLCQHLMSVDGVGPITASTYIATIDDPRRFENGDRVAAYLGLVPRVHQSGETEYRGRITKEGDSLLRSLLVEAATVLLTRVKRPSALKEWGLRLQKEKGFGKARVAVARKLACILHAMWLSGERFQPAMV